MNEKLQGWCISWDADDHPRLEECEVEVQGGMDYRRASYHNGKQTGYEFCTPGVDFFTERLPGLKVLRKLLVKQGEECQKTIERVGLDVWGVDSAIEQERKYGHEGI
jgi:hypothetical protein